jgi:predicted Zn-dependent peptidase
MFRNIREREGFAYDAHAGHQPRGDRGLFSAVTQVRDEVVEPALQAVLKEMDTLGKEPVAAAELSAVKNYLNGVFVLQLENQAGLAEQLVALRLQNLPRDYLETYVTRVRSVEPDQIQAAARKYMSPEKTAIVVVGGAAKIRVQVEKFGKPVIEKAK